MLIYSLTKFYLGFPSGKKKKRFEGNPPLLPSTHFCCVCVAQQIINSLYFVFHYLFRGRFFFFFKGLDSSHLNLRIE